LGQAVEVDQHVDLVGSDQPGGRLIRHIADEAAVVEGRNHTPPDVAAVI